MQKAKASEGAPTFGKEWYDNSHMWDKMPPDYPSISFAEALELLRGIEGEVVFISEARTQMGSSALFCAGEKIIDFAAEANAEELAELIEKEWFEAYRLAEQDMYNPCAVLPDDIYVFDRQMSRLIVFTHETTDWESELDNPMKAAESRLCIQYGMK